MKLAWRMTYRLGKCLSAGGAVAGVLLASNVSGQVVYQTFPVRQLSIDKPGDKPGDQPGDKSGQPTHQDERVSIVTRDSTLDYTIREIARQAHWQVIFTSDASMSSKRVSVNLTNVGAMDAITRVLNGTGLAAKLATDGETVIIHAQSRMASRSQLFTGLIIGRVIDSASGGGLGGAAVKVQGTKLSAVTSDSGNFRLSDVPSGEHVLSVRLFGYKPVDRTVTVVDSQRTTVRIVMASVPTVLSGVVTTATGLQRRVEVGNDITTLNVDSISQIAPIMTVTDLLETRVPGLTVLHTAGVPGDPARIRLRGNGSVQLNNDPILIVDGIRVYASQSDPRNNNLAPEREAGGSNPRVINPNASGAFAAPSPLDQIDPASIATIEVLKGPSATAIYGSDAGNGVIIITTKHGRAGPTHWNLALGGGISWLPGAWPQNYYRLGHYGASPGSGQTPDQRCLWSDLTCTTDSIVAFQALNDPRYTVLSHGNDQTADLTVSGGTPTLTYSVTGSGGGTLGNLKFPSIVKQAYDSAYGAVPNTLARPDRYTTWGVSGSVTATPKPTVSVTLQSSLFNGEQQQSSLNGAITQLSGEYLTPFLVQYAGGPLIQNEVQQATDNQLSQTNSMTLSWRPVTWLPILASGGINTIQRTDVTYIPYGVNAEGPNTVSSRVDDTTGWYGLGRGSSRDQTINIGTTVPLKGVAVAIGGNFNTKQTADFNVSTDRLAPGVSVPTSFLTCNAGDGSCTNSSTAQSTTGASTYGWYLEPTFSAASRFFVSPGFRLDGGSGGAQSGGSVGGLSAFPKINLSYLAVDRQSQPPLLGFLSVLRPRLAFGLAGTQPAPADKLRLFNINVGSGNAYTNTPPGGSPLEVGSCDGTVALNATTTVPAVCLSSLGNTQLRPERSKELEGGFDADFWGQRLTITYSRYNKTRTDAILEIPVAPSVSGLNENTFSIQKNIGEVRNTGTEISAKAFLLETRSVSWNVGANLSNNNNLVVRLNAGQPPIVLANGSGSIQERVTAGYPLFGEWARPIASFADLNHNGIIEPNEVQYADSAVYVGQPDPKYQLNFTSDLSLLQGRLSVHATVSYQNGLTQDNQSACSSGAFGLIPNAPHSSLSTQAAVVASGCLGNNPVTAIGLVQTVSTLRFQDLSINYELPRSMATWFHVPRMSLAVQGSNLGLHTNYRGLDPDVNAFSTVSAGDETADLGQIPEPRTWWLKLTLGN